MQPVHFSKCECRHCAGHIEFPAPAGGQTVTCPHCGQPTELPAVARTEKKFLLISVIALTVVIAAIAGMVFLKKSVVSSATGKIIPPVTNAPAAQPTEAATMNNFSISEFKLEKTPGSSLVYVTGTARNLTAQQRFGVRIVFSLLDTNQTAVGTASDYRPVLEANVKWNFKALVMESKAAAARLDSVREEK
jgi:hypothetical protein